MARKRKTLPKNFEEIIASCTDDEIISTLEKCEVNAYGGYGKGNAFFFALSEDVMKWLLDRGENIEFKNQFGYTPLMDSAFYYGGQNHCLKLIKLGADINVEHTRLYKYNLLHAACSSKHYKLVKLLVDAGLDMSKEDWNGDNPLEFAFRRNYAIDMIKLAPIAEYMIAHGAPVTSKLKKYFKEKAEDFEFRRDNVDKDLACEVDAAFDILNKLFDVKKVPQRVLHDGKSIIEIHGKTWLEQYNELWNMLVPASGHANTIQGEVIRITGRISHEILDNGGCNWDVDFKKMVQSLNEYLHIGNKLASSEYDELNQFFKSIKSADESLFNRQAELSVKWISQNREPITLTQVDYNR